MEGSDEVTRRSDRLMATAVEEAQTLLGKRDPNALLAVALSNALAALTVEIRGLRLAQEASVNALHGETIEAQVEEESKTHDVS